MKRPTDTDLLRKAVQEKLRGASETPPEGGFQRIQSALSKRSGGVSSLRGLGIGLSVIVVLTTSLLLLPGEHKQPDLIGKTSHHQDESSLTQKEPVPISPDRGSEGEKNPSLLGNTKSRNDSNANDLVKTSQPLSDTHNNRHTDQTVQKSSQDANQSPVKVTNIAHKPADIPPKRDADVSIEGSAYAMSNASDIEQKRNEEHTRRLTDPVTTRNEAGKNEADYSVTKTFLADSIKATKTTTQDASTIGSSHLAEIKITAHPGTDLSKNTRGKEEVLTLQPAKSSLSAYGLSHVYQALESRPSSIKLPVYFRKRTSYYYELAFNSAALELTHIDAENYISHNRDMRWSFDQLGAVLGAGISHLLMRNIYLKGTVRYTYFSRRYTYNVAQRIAGATISINDQPEPVYYSTELRKDLIRHHGLGLYTGIEFGLANDRYIGLGIGYSKSLVNDTFDTSMLSAEGYIGLASFMIKGSRIWAELRIRHGLNGWQNDIINYKARQFGINLKYELKDSK